MPAETGIVIFQRAEQCYARGQVNTTFELYQRAIKKILKDEVLTAKLPAIVPDEAPEEALCFIWMNFLGFFRDPAMNFTAETSPEAYKLLKSFRPSAQKEYTRFRGERGQTVLKAMQITAGLTLGLLAWDKKDRATAAKRYKEAIDLAQTHPPFVTMSPGVKHLEKWVAKELAQAKDNMDVLVRNDIINSEVLKAKGEGGGDLRKEVVSVPNTRIEDTGKVSREEEVMVATDKCATCGVRGVKMPRCSLCKSVAYCGTACQKADWKAHKLSCKQIN